MSQSEISLEIKFARKIYMCVMLLGGGSDILSTIGSWRQELSDEQVFDMLDSWIEETILERNATDNYIKKWHRNWQYMNSIPRNEISTKYQKVLDRINSPGYKGYDWTEITEEMDKELREELIARTGQPFCFYRDKEQKNGHLLSFDKYDLKVYSKKNNSVTYRRHISKTSFVEVFDAKGVISVDLVNADDRLIVASRYECKTQDELDFILTKGRTKAIFTSA